MKIDCPCCGKELEVINNNTGRTNCYACGKSFSFDKEKYLEYKRKQRPLVEVKEIARCPTCGTEVKIRNNESGRSTCSKCKKVFTFDHDKFINHTRKYAIEHKEQINEWKQNNIERTRELARNHYHKHIDKIRKRHKIATDKFNGVSSISLEGICEICQTIPDRKMHRHHIIPKRAGGKDEEENLVRLCNKHHMQLEGRIRVELAMKYTDEYKEITMKLIEEMREEEKCN